MSTVSFGLEEKKEMRQKTAKSLIYVGIGSIVMFFAAFTSIYIVRQTEGGSWVDFEIPPAFYTSTWIILLSSAMLWMALRSAKNDKTILIQVGLLGTFLLGIGFLFSQVEAWRQINEAGLFFSDKSNASGSFIYVITGAHMAHLGAGLLALLYSFVKSLLKSYNSSNFLGLEVLSIYWHFLGVLWIYLLLFLVYIR